MTRDELLTLADELHARQDDIRTIEFRFVEELLRSNISLKDALKGGLVRPIIGASRVKFFTEQAK